MPKAPSAASVRSPRLRVYLLGAFRLERDSPNRPPRGSTRKHAEPVHLPTRKVESLIAFLVLHPEPHAREQLAALLWGDVPDDLAHSSLRRALVLLRQALGSDLLLTDRTSIQLNPDLPLWADAHTFQSQAESFLHSANSGSAINLDLYQGDLLSDFYDDWIAPRREQFRSLYLNVLLALAQQQRARAEYAGAIDFAQQVLRRDPANESAHQIVMFGYAALGKHIEALQQFESCKHVLREELGVEASPETLALAQWIKEQRAANTASRARITNLPVPLTSFIGREREVAELKGLLQATRLITLTGAGGCGKTRLAIQLGVQVVDQIKDGVWWVDLAGLREEALVEHAIAQTLGVREVPHQSLLETLTNFLQAKRLLLILDDCEHLLEACAQISGTLLTHCSDLRVLATSRQTFNVAGETAWIVPSLALPTARFSDRDRMDQEVVGAISDSEAVRLFVERARAIKRDFALTDQNAFAVAQICQRLDGIPLAIELAVARINFLSPEQIAARLDDRFNLLTRGSRTALPRHQTLRALIDWSYDLLLPAERVVLRRLGVFAGGWMLEAAEQVTSNGPQSVPTNQVLDLLGHLVDKSLVVVEEKGDAVRYRMLETIREYARERLIEAGEADQVQTRHLEYFVRLAEQAEPELKGEEQLDWLNRLDTENDNLRAALSWADEKSGEELGLRLAWALWRFWYLRGYFGEGQKWLERALEKSGNASTVLRAKLLTGAGSIAFSQGNYQQAAVWHQKALALSRELEDRQGMAFALNNLALAMQLQGNYSLARPLFEESLALYQAESDKWGMATVLGNLGLGEALQGNYDRATTFFEEDLALSREVGDKRLIALGLHNLGDVARYQADYQRGAVLLKESLSLAQELGDKWLTALTLHILGLIARDEGNLERAATLLKEGLELSRELGEKLLLAEGLEGLAGVASRQEEPRRAAQLVAAAQALRETITSPIPPTDRAQYDAIVAVVRAQLDETTFQRAWAEGRAMTLEQAVEYALEGHI